MEEERAGLLLDWGTQTDRASLEALIQECETSVGFGFKAGAAIKFVADPNHHCRIPNKRRVAGCWMQDFDLIVLEPAPRLGETAICHELLHRQLFERRSDPDNGHVAPEWSALAAGLSRFNASRPADDVQPD